MQLLAIEWPKVLGHRRPDHRVGEGQTPSVVGELARHEARAGQRIHRGLGVTEPGHTGDQRQR